MTPSSDECKWLFHTDANLPVDLDTHHIGWVCKQPFPHWHEKQASFDEDE